VIQFPAIVVAHTGIVPESNVKVDLLTRVLVYGGGALVAAAVLGVAEAMPAWLAALIVALVLLLVAGVLAVVGKRKVASAGPPVPEQALRGVKQDVKTVKESAKR
jgi:hypothetical protein